MPSPESTDSPPALRGCRWFVAAVVVLVLLDAAKHALLWSTGLGQPWSDSVGYWRLGTDVARGDIGMLQTAWGYRTPGYPWFFGGLIATLGESRAFVAAITIQHLAVLATDLLVGWWTLRLTRSMGVALIASLAMVLSTARPLYANWLLTESLATFFLTLAAFLLWSTGQRGLGRLVAASAVAAVGILVRPSLVVLAPLVVAIAIIDAWRIPLSFGRRIFRVALPTVILLGLLAPWCGRNAHLFGRWTLLTFTGRELWTANFSPWPGANLTVPDDGPGEELRRRLVDAPSIDLRHNASVAGALTKSGLNDAETDRLMERTAWLAIRRDPGRSAVHVLARTGTFWYCKEYAPPPPLDAPVFRDLVPPEQPATERVTAKLLAASPERTFLGTWAWSGLTVIALLVAIWSPLLRRAGLIVGILLAGTTLLTAILEIPLYRYRLPLEPLTVVVLAAVVWDRFFRGSPPPGTPVGQDKSSPVQ